MQSARRGGYRAAEGAGSSGLRPGDPLDQRRRHRGDDRLRMGDLQRLAVVPIRLSQEHHARRLVGRSAALAFRRDVALGREWARLCDTGCPFREFHPAGFTRRARISASSGAMLAILRLLGMFLADQLKSRARLEAEVLFLRHQLNISLRRAPPRVRLRGSDRAVLVWMTRLWPKLLGAVQVVQPETILRWHRAGFKAFWRWKSRCRRGRPRVDRELRDLIRQMSQENPLGSTANSW